MKASQRIFQGLSRSQRSTGSPLTVSHGGPPSSIPSRYPKTFPIKSSTRSSSFQPLRSSCLSRPSIRFMSSDSSSADRRPSSTTHSSSTASSAPSPPRTASSNPEPFAQLPPEQQAAYELHFRCKPCSHRSRHKISKHGYHNGTVVVTCPLCRARHVVADHLNIFLDKRMTLDQILKEKGETIKTGRLGVGGDVEFWDDGTVTSRNMQNEEDENRDLERERREAEEERRKELS